VIRMSHPPAGRRLALRLLPWLFLAACSLPTKTAYVTGQAPAASERVLWEVCRLTLQEQGLQLSASGFDPKTKGVVSMWRISLHPFRGQGFRERAHVSYAEAGQGRVEFTVRVERQSNQNIAKPLDPEYAKWEDADDDEGRAQLILARLQVRLGGGPRVVADPKG
jgi:hypothetical protein